MTRHVGMLLLLFSLLQADTWELAKERDGITVYTRNVEGSPFLAFKGVTVVEGDLSDKESLRGTVQGCDYLFHVAADYRLWIPDPAVVYRINVDGTRDLIEIATDAGVKKIIYTSSVAT